MTNTSFNSRFALPAIIAGILAVVVIAVELTRLAAGPSPEPQKATEEYGEWLARPAELANVSSNRIARSLRLNAQAMVLGKAVYQKNCAQCHGDDLKGRNDLHTPDLTDADWRFGGDDLASGGARKYPSDVEWTVRYGIRSGNPNARGAEVNMLAYDPQYRTEDDKEDFGTGWFLNLEEIDDVVEHVLKISGQDADPAKAARGEVLFHDGAKGNCYDCHGEDGTGIDTFGSTNLTRKDLYLFGSDRASIRESIVKGRRGVMPAFDEQLKPEEIKAVSVFVFSHAQTQ
jgi:cytochrome c oxidase cbb3-type subunit III